MPPEDTGRYDQLIAQGAEFRTRADQFAHACAGQISISQLTTTARIHEDLEVVERRISAAQPVLGRARP